MIKTLSSLGLTIMISFTIIGQNIPSHIQQVLNKKASEWELETTDLSELRVSDNYFDPNTGIQYVYLQQTINGIPIDRSITPVAINPNGNIHLSGHGFYKNIQERAIESKGQFIPIEQGILYAAQSMNIALPERLLSTSSRW